MVLSAATRATPAVAVAAPISPAASVSGSSSSLASSASVAAQPGGVDVEVDELLRAELLDQVDGALEPPIAALVR